MICPDYQETEKHPKVTVRVLIHKTMDRTDKTSLFKTVTQNTQYFFLPQPILHRSTLFFFFLSLTTLKDYQMVIPLILLSVLCWKELILNLCYSLVEKQMCGGQG